MLACAAQVFWGAESAPREWYAQGLLFRSGCRTYCVKLVPQPPSRSRAQSPSRYQKCNIRLHAQQPLSLGNQLLKDPSFFLAQRGHRPLPTMIYNGLYVQGGRVYPAVSSFVVQSFYPTHSTSDISRGINVSLSNII